MTKIISKKLPSSLLELYKANEPFYQKIEWFIAFSRFVSFDDLGDRYLATTEDKHSLLLPLQISNISLFGGLLKGRQLNSMTNYYSPYFELTSNGVASQLSHTEFLEQFKRYLIRVDQIQFKPLIESEMNQFREGFKRLGLFVSSYVSSVNWYEDNIRGVNDYWEKRPNKLKNTIRRKKAKLDKMGGYELVVHKATDLVQALADFHRVYYYSWKTNEPFPAFIDEIARIANENKELRLGIIYHNNKPIAAQMWFVNDKTAYIFKLAHRPEVEKLSVGSILTAAMVDYVIEKDKVTKIDFLTGNDNYKKDWMSKSRPLYTLTAYNTHSLVGGLGAIKSFLDREQK